MANLKDLLKPNLMKIILTIGIFFPFLILEGLIFGAFFASTNGITGMYFYLYFLQGVIFTYLISSFFDYSIKSRNTKISIFIVSSLITLFMIFIFLFLGTF